MSIRCARLLQGFGWLLIASALFAALALSSSPALAQSNPPDAPASVTVTRGTFGQGLLNVSWRAVKGAAFYNVRYSDDGGQTWDDGPSRVFGASASVSGVNDSLPYYVAVQAENGKGASGWTQSALANVECPEGHACAMTDPPGAEAQSNPPDAPASVTVTRGTFGQGLLNVSWRAVKGAAFYNVRYSDDGGQTWDDGPSRVFGASASVSGVNDSLPYYVAVQAENGKGASGWTQSALANVECPEGHACAMTNPPGAEAQSNPPDAPSSITFERTGVGFRGKGTLTASWPAVSGATKYEVHYTADKGRVWKTLASEHTSTSITFEIWNGNTYYVRVRAGNANGWSGWTQSLESPPIPNPLPSNMLPAPDWVSVTRGDGTLTATWAAVSGAIKYRIEYSTNFGATFQLLSDNHTSTSYIINNADNGSTYTIAVRAGKSNNYFSFGPIAYSAPSGPYVPNYTPPPSPSLSTGSVTHNTATLTLSNYGGQWWYKADTAPHATCSSTAVAGSSVNLSGLTPSTQYTYTAYSNWVCNTAIATASAFTTLAPPATLTASATGRTTATLTIANHTAQWWYQADVGPDSTCQGPVAAGTSAESLTGIDRGNGLRIQGVQRDGLRRDQPSGHRRVLHNPPAAARHQPGHYRLRRLGRKLFQAAGSRLHHRPQLDRIHPHERHPPDAL